MIADRPTPPQPWTATHSPGCTRALVDDGAKRGDEAAAEAGGRGEIEVVVQPDKIGVGKIERHIFRERSPGREARLELSFADLVVAGIAFEAMAAAADEGRGHAIADAPAADLAADRGNRTGKLVSRHMRQHDVGIMPHPAVPVAAAKPRRLDLDYHAMRRRRRIGNGPYTRRRSELFIDDALMALFAPWAIPLIIQPHGDQQTQRPISQGAIGSAALPVFARSHSRIEDVRRKIRSRGCCIPARGLVLSTGASVADLHAQPAEHMPEA